MKKIFFHNFFPTKEEELVCLADNSPHKAFRVLMEIRDIHPPLVMNYLNSWKIHKLSMFEVCTRKIVISFNEAFEYIFRYWSLNLVNYVVTLNKLFVCVYDVSDPRNPKKHDGDSVYFDMVLDDDYTLACKSLFQDLNLSIGDEIGLFYDPNASCFMFKLIFRAV